MYLDLFLLFYLPLIESNRLTYLSMAILTSPAILSFGVVPGWALQNTTARACCLSLQQNTADDYVCCKYWTKDDIRSSR